jgi:hypothetical protein
MNRNAPVRYFQMYMVEAAVQGPAEDVAIVALV